MSGTAHTSHIVPTLQNRRGAAFLLSVYIAALTLLLLGGVSLQRTAIDVRASQLSRDVQQAFFLAEGGLDQALKAIDTADAGNGEMPGGGTYDYTVTRQIEVLTPQLMRTTYTVTSNGSAARRDATVSGLVVKEGPLQEGFAQGRVTSSGGCGSTTIVGSVHSGQGIPPTAGVPASIELLADNLKVHGDLTIEPPNPKTPYTDLFGFATQNGTIVSGDNPGLLLHDQYVVGNLLYARDYNAWQPWGSEEAAIAWAAKEVVTGSITTADLATIPGMWSPYKDVPPPVYKATPQNLAKRFVMKNSSTDPNVRVRRDITDGDTTWDASPAGDGKIVVRMSTLQLWPRTQLVFNAPTTIYVEKSETITPEGIPSVVASYKLSKPTDTAVYVGEDATLTAVDAQGRTMKGGIEIVVTKRTDGKSPGGVLVTKPEAFFSSIWAPDSPVAVGGYINGQYDPAQDRFVGDQGFEPGTTGSKWTPSYGCWGDVCPPLVGGRGGAQSRYIVSKNLWLGGTVAIGKAGNQAPSPTPTEDSEGTQDTSHNTLSIWKVGPPDTLTAP